MNVSADATLSLVVESNIASVSNDWFVKLISNKDGILILISYVVMLFLLILEKSLYGFAAFI